MQKLALGQRFMSEAEPELGLGVIVDLQDKTLSVEFPATGESRQYGKKSAPLKRIKFDVEDEVSDNKGNTFIVTEVQILESGLYVYFGEEEHQTLLETDLKDSVSFHHPEEKLLSATSDRQSFFNLRIETLKHLSFLSSLDLRGLIGGRLSLIDHQLYLADKITKREHPRVLLADEVGLGKTIEAGLILNKLLITNRAKRVLIVVPNTLTYQWFIEMYRKYNLSFAVINEQTRVDEHSNPFEENDLVITSMQLLAGSKKAFDFAKNAGWDLLIVDEAHKLKWTPEEEGPLYSVIKSLSQKIASLLLLTATPEMFGQEGHFARLKLIDPDRFFDFEEFKSESSHYFEMAQIGRKIISDEDLTDKDQDLLKKEGISYESKTELLDSLLDRHGTGRIYFKNSRKVMGQIYSFFPKRIPHYYPLEELKQNEYLNIESDENFKSKSYLARIEWLIKFLKEHANKKVLLICRSKKKILKIEKDLMEMSVNNKIALFHGDLSLMAQDRQAAYFADPEGANILLCTEIGSEGRNFEFSDQLILFDLPQNPDLLEQRIGRLDRIGQKNDIHIHIPFLKNSWEEILFKWYQDGVHSFEKTSQSGMKLYSEFEERLNHSFENVKDSLESDKLEQIILETQKRNEIIIKELDKGQDQLIELNSFNKNIAKSIKERILEIDESKVLKNYLEKVFSHFGVDVEDLNDTDQFIKPNENMFIPHFPGLTQEGLSFTYSRYKALQREDLHFMSWDHPLVIGIMDLIKGESFGNLTVTTRIKNSKPKIFLEFFYLLEAIAPAALEVSTFLPPKMIRVLLNPDGESFTQKWDKEKLDSVLTDADKSIVLAVSKFPKSKLKGLIKKGLDEAKISQDELIKDAIDKASIHFNKEINRLVELQKVNKLIKDIEVDRLKERKNLVIEFIKDSVLGHDSFRFIY